jgi:hypothetical protein
LGDTGIRRFVVACHLIRSIILVTNPKAKLPRRIQLMIVMLQMIILWEMAQVEAYLRRMPHYHTPFEVCHGSSHPSGFAFNPFKALHKLSPCEGWVLTAPLSPILSILFLKSWASPYVSGHRLTLRTSLVLEDCLHALWLNED